MGYLNATDAEVTAYPASQGNPERTRTARESTLSNWLYWAAVSIGGLVALGGFGLGVGMLFKSLGDDRRKRDERQLKEIKSMMSKLLDDDRRKRTRG